MLKLLRLIVIFASLSIVIAANYDAVLAREYWYISSASYCRQSKIVDWTCGQPCQAPRPVDVKAFFNSTAHASGFAAYNPSRNQIMVVFRGTVPWLIQNWVADIDFVKQSFPLCDNGCQVHKGFHQSYLELNQQVLSAVQALRQKYPYATLLITGHSLGAAIATHALLYLQKSGYKIDHFITYGSPRVGDKKFSDYLKKSFSGFKQRVTHSHDPVPHLPFQQWGFDHINTEVYYPHTVFNKAVFTLCNDASEEDGACSNRNLADLNIDDHVHYFDLDQLVATPLCQ